MSFVSNIFHQTRRQISTSSVLSGKRNFKKFLLYNKRGPRSFKEDRHLTNPDMPIDKRGVKDTGVVVRGKYFEISEKIPQLIVPDLTGFELKPYVSYKTPYVIQSEFTSQDLFNAIYAKKIIDDFKNDKLGEDGSSLEPSTEEQTTADEAHFAARKTGSDIF